MTSRHRGSAAETPRSKRLALLLGAACVVTALIAPNASATAYRSGFWYQNGVKLGSTQRPISCELGVTGGQKKLTIRWPNVKIQASGVSCTSRSGVFNEPNGGLGYLQPTLENVEVLEPAGCGIVSPLRLNPLKFALYKESGKELAQIESTVSGSWGDFQLTTCSVSGHYHLGGTTLQEWALPEGEAVNQPLNFSRLTEASGNHLYVPYGGPATIQGQIIVQDGGLNFGFKEK